MEQEFDSLRPFKQTRDLDADQKEIKRSKFQTAYLIKEFLCKMKNLRVLILKSNKLGDDGVSIIAEAINSTKSSIKKLDISQTGITVESFKILLFNMKNNISLSTLILDKNNLNSSFAFTSIAHVIAVANTL